MKKLSLIALSVLTVLGGCSSSHSSKTQAIMDKVTDNLDGGFEERVKEIEPVRSVIGQVKKGPAYHDVNNYSLIETDDRRLPSSFDKPVFISDENEPYTVDSFSALLYSAYGIVLDVSSPDLDVLAEAKDDQQPSVASPFANITADSAGEYSESEQGETKSTSRDELTLKPFKFKGTVKELLDYVTILNGIKWKYDNDFKKAYMYANETREFFIYDFGDEVETSTKITTTTSQEADSTSGGSQKEVSRENNVDAWKEITESISSMLSPDGKGKASFDRKTGLVVVTDSDYALSRINKYVDRLNDSSSKEIVIQYRVIRFKYDEKTGKGINQNYLNEGLQNNLFGSFDLQYGTGGLSPNISGNLGAFQEIMGGNFLTLANQSHEMLMGFLNSIGTANLAYENQVPILNNDIYTHQGGENQEYISSIERSTISSGVGQENITTKKDVAVDGVNMTLLPRITGDRIKVKYSISNSDFIGLTEAGLGAGNEGVQLKNDSSLDIDHTAQLKNGVPRVIQFIHEKEDSADSQGMFDHGFWFLGGNENRTQTKSAIIVTMTASYNN